MFNQTLLQGYVKNNMAKKAIDLFYQVNIPDKIIVTILFNACAQLGTKEALNVAKAVSEQIPKSFYSNSYVLPSLLDVLMKCGEVTEAELLFNTSRNKDLSMYGTMMKGNSYSIHDHGQ